MDWMTHIAVLVGQKLYGVIEESMPPKVVVPKEKREPVDLVKVVEDEMKRRGIK